MDVSVPTFDSTRLHARAALEYALGADGDAIFPRLGTSDRRRPQTLSPR